MYFIFTERLHYLKRNIKFNSTPHFNLLKYVNIKCNLLTFWNMLLNQIQTQEDIKNYANFSIKNSVTF